MVLLTKNSIEAGILLSLALFAVGCAGFLEQNETVASATEQVAKSSKLLFIQSKISNHGVVDRTRLVSQLFLR